MSAYAQPSTRPLLAALADGWWLLLLRGFAAIGFGVLAFAWPGLTLLSLTVLWGAYAFADGLLTLGAAVAGRGEVAPRWWLALAGVLGIVAGVLTFLWPGVTAQVLLLFIAAWAIATGVLQVLGAARLRAEIDDEWLLVLGGALSILFGALLLLRPAAGALAVAWLIGGFAILVGCDYVALAFRLKRHKAPG